MHQTTRWRLWSWAYFIRCVRKCLQQCRKDVIQEWENLHPQSSLLLSAKQRQLTKVAEQAETKTIICYTIVIYNCNNKRTFGDFLSSFAANSEDKQTQWNHRMQIKDCSAFPKLTSVRCLSKSTDIHLKASNLVASESFPSSLLTWHLFKIRCNHTSCNAAPY